jgi:site-specific DNA recombinase
MKAIPGRKKKAVAVVRRKPFDKVEFLVCPVCARKLTGSFSQGSTKKYPYYHCPRKCKTRINALMLNDSYKQQLQQLSLSNKVTELFNCILEDSNKGTQKAEYLQVRNNNEAT